MDTDQLSCAKCGHLLKEGAEACAYCGTAAASADLSPTPDENSPDLSAQAAEQPVESSEDAPPAGETADATPGTPVEKPEAEPSRQGQPEETRQVIEESAAEVASAAAGSVAEADDQIDFQLPDDELVVEFDDEAAKEPGQASDADRGSAETTKPATESGMDDVVGLKQDAAEGAAEVIPLSGKASAKAISKDTPDLPETPVVEVSGEDSSESETLGADILELVEDEAGKTAAIQDQLSGNPTPTDEAAAVKAVAKAPEPASNDTGTKKEDIEAILLTSDDEAQSETASPAEDTGQTLKPTEAEEPIELAALAGAGTAKTAESTATDDAQASLEAAKIEKAAKTKKAALAKAQALKKKKLQLAKAQALKKQREAQAGSAKAGKAADADAGSVQSMETNTQLLGLLKKYEGQTIGINFDNSADIKEAELVATNAEFISVFVKDQELTFCHPLKTILTVIEGKDGVETGNSEQQAKFNAVVKVYPLVLF